MQSTLRNFFILRVIQYTCIFCTNNIMHNRFTINKIFFQFYSQFNCSKFKHWESQSYYQYGSMCRLWNIASATKCYYQENVTNGQTEGQMPNKQMPNKVIPMSSYALQATQKRHRIYANMSKLILFYWSAPASNRSFVPGIFKQFNIRIALLMKHSWSNCSRGYFLKLLFSMRKAMILYVKVTLICYDALLRNSEYTCILKQLCRFSIEIIVLYHHRYFCSSNYALPTHHRVTKNKHTTYHIHIVKSF